MTSKGREYWHFQTYQDGGRTRRFVGPVAEPEITSRVERFTDIKADFSQRRDLVRALGQVLPRPDALTGDIVEVLWKAGFFRLRGVLIGTVAFQAYAGLLGVKLPGSSILTQDADFAQFKAISGSFTWPFGRSRSRASAGRPRLTGIAFKCALIARRQKQIAARPRPAFHADTASGPVSGVRARKHEAPKGEASRYGTRALPGDMRVRL